MRECIKLITITTHEMTKYRTRYQCGLAAQTFNETWHVLLWIKTQTMHTRIKFDMNREVGDTLLLGSVNQLFQQIETEHLWLKTVVKKHLERGGFWVHNHDVGCDACLTKIHSFIGYCHRQVIHSIVLQGLARLQGTHTIATRLHHTHHLRLWFHETAIVAYVVDQCIEIDLKNRLMHFQRQKIAHLVKTELAGSLDKDEFIT